MQLTSFLFHSNIFLQYTHITHIILIHLDVGILDAIAERASKIPSITKHRRGVSFHQNEINNMLDLIQEVPYLSTMDWEDIML